MSTAHHYDAIVIGVVPSGSTTGALLAEKGRNVLILEKEFVGLARPPFPSFFESTP